MIDLHTHTTASDGRSSPARLIEEAHAAGCRTIAVTDHDTVAGVTPAREAAAAAGIDLVAGIEVTAVAGGVDVHILGYFIDIADEDLAAFLRLQRQRRRDRIAAIGARLEQLGIPIETATILNESPESGRAVGRPAVAQALVAGGHATDVADAFDRLLAEGRPAYLPRVGPNPAEVVARLHAAGGLASLAHPGKLKRDGLVESMAGEGLDAIEVYHPDHSVADVVRYQALADRYGLLISGGSDYHGPGSGRVNALGAIGLPPAAFARLLDRAGRVA